MTPKNPVKFFHKHFFHFLKLFVEIVTAFINKRKMPDGSIFDTTWLIFLHHVAHFLIPHGSFFAPHGSS